MEKHPKETSLTNIHRARQAKMVNFGGWLMPLQYTSLISEHRAVRSKVGLFDVSHMGEVRVTGKDAAAFLNYVTVNDVTKLVDGQAQYTAMTTEKGTVVDDLLLYRISDTNYLLVVNAANIDKDFTWLYQRQKSWKITLRNESETTGQIAIQGPLAEQVLQKLVHVDLSQVAYYHFVQTHIGNTPLLISRTGYTGEDGFECYAPAKDLASLWTQLEDRGREEGIHLVGLGARDTLRLEACMHLYGNDMDETTTVLEAGLAWITKLKKDCDFIGKKALQAQKKAGLKRKLVGFEVLGKGIARQHYPVIQDNQTIGVVTSGTMSPTLQKSIGLAYLPIAFAKSGSIVNIKIRNKVAEAAVIKKPFYKRAQN